MNLDKYIKECLKSGFFWINNYSDNLLCATFGIHNKESLRVYSDKGTNHLLCVISAKVLKIPILERFAERNYRYPVAVGRKTELHNLVSKGVLRIFLVKDILHVEQYASAMQSLKQKTIGPTMRSAIGQRFQKP